MHTPTVVMIDGKQVELTKLIEAYGGKDARIAAMTWQPIETAPKDGTWVLLQGRFKRGPWALPVIGVWSSYSESWQDYESRVEKPTHWMPLPEPPR